MPSLLLLPFLYSLGALTMVSWSGSLVWWWYPRFSSPQIFWFVKQRRSSDPGCCRTNQEEAGQGAYASPSPEKIVVTMFVQRMFYILPISLKNGEEGQRRVSPNSLNLENRPGHFFSLFHFKEAVERVITDVAFFTRGILGQVETTSPYFVGTGDPNSLK